MRLKSCTAVLVLVLLTGSAIMLPTTPGYAATTCGSAGHFFAGRGYQPPSAEPDGSIATIDVKSATLCDEAFSGAIYSDETAWSMIASDGTNPSTDNGYAQVGWIHKSTGTNLRFFYEWTKCGSCHFVQVYWGTPVYGNSYTFKVVQQSDGYLHMFVNGNTPPCSGQYPSDCAVTSFNPDNSWPGTNNEWFGETQHPGDDQPGTGTDRAQFISVKTLLGGTWLNRVFNFGGVTPAKCYYHENDVTTDSHFEIWTNPLSHSC